MNRSFAAIEAVYKLLTRLATIRLARTLGLGLFLAGLVIYRSYERQDILGMWSYQFSAIVVAVALLFGLSLVWSLRKLKGSSANTSFPGVRQKVFDAALLINGFAYWLSTADDPTAAGRLLKADLWGSVFPPAAMLEWIAMILWFLSAALWVMPRLGKAMAKPAFTVAAVIMTLLVVEGLTRLKVAVAPSPQGHSTFSSTLWKRRHVRLNAEGFRDVDHRPEKDHGTRRLLVIGDSYAFGWGIMTHHARFGERAAAILTDRTGEPWEAINGSLPGTHTLDHIGFLDRMAKFHPDVTVLVYVFNDIDYLAAPAASYAPNISSAADRFRPRWLLFANSYLFHEVLVRSRLLYYQFVDEAWFSAGDDPYLAEDTLERHLQDLKHFTEKARCHEGAVGVVPFDLRVTLGGKHLARYERFVQRARRLGIPVWDPASAFDEHEYTDLILNSLDRHPNEIANRLVAEAVVDEIANILNPPPVS